MEINTEYIAHYTISKHVSMACRSPYYNCKVLAITVNTLSPWQFFTKCTPVILTTCIIKLGYCCKHNPSSINLPLLTGSHNNGSIGGISHPIVVATC